MAIYTGMKTDYSFLFSSLSTNKSGSSGNLLSNISLTDYNNIKSGTYYKLMKAYYGRNAAEDSSSTVTEKEKTTRKTATDASEIKTDASSLYSAVDKLTTTGSKSVFKMKDITTTNEDGTKTTERGYDTDTIRSAVKNFVKNYNELLSSAGDSSNSSISRVLRSMTNLTLGYSSQLEAVGIKVGDDKTLTLDEDTFNSADMSAVKSLFNGTNSYASNVGGYASSIGAYANSDLNAGNTYTSYGSYSALQSGINYSSFF